MTGEREQGMQLGRIVAQGDEHTRQLTALFRVVDDIRREQSETSGVAKEALRLATSTALELQKEVVPHIEDYKGLKAKGFGVLGVIAILGGGAATIIARVWGNFWPH